MAVGTALARRKTRLAERRAALDLSRPSEQEREALLSRTRAAIDRLIAAELDAQEPDIKKGKPAGPVKSSYNPKGSARAYELTIEEQQNDPLEPPRHRYQKPKPFEDGALTIASASTRAPILRQAPRQLSRAEKEAWEIPRSVSNWKNDRGVLVDLDVRASSSAGPAAAVDAEAQGHLASALAQAANEEDEEKRRLRTAADEQQLLRQRLRDQRDSRRESAQTEELFDSRLFHAGSRKTQALYDEPLFKAAKRPRQDPERRVRYEQ